MFGSQNDGYQLLTEESGGVFLGIDLVITVFDAILTSRQTREKLKCLIENLMQNNFHKTTVLKKIWIVN